MKRRERRRGGFLLGVVAGVATGVAGGMLLIRRMYDTETFAVVPPSEVEQTDGVQPAIEAAQQLPVAARQRAQTMLDVLVQRWNLAMEAGKQAAAETTAELYRKLSQDRKQESVDLVTASRIDEVSEKMGEIAGESR